MLTEFGKLVRKARIEIGTSMMKMAEDLGVSAAFLSSIETGRRSVPDQWIERIEHYFADRGHRIEGLGKAASISNKSVSLEGLSREHQTLVAGFARVQSSALNPADLDAFRDLLLKLEKKGK